MQARKEEKQWGKISEAHQNWPRGLPAVFLQSLRWDGPQAAPRESTAIRQMPASALHRYYSQSWLGRLPNAKRVSQT